MNNWDADLLVLSHRPMGRGYIYSYRSYDWPSKQRRLFDTLFRRIRFRLGSVSQKERDGWAYNIVYTIDRYLDLAPTPREFCPCGEMLVGGQCPLADS